MKGWKTLALNAVLVLIPITDMLLGSGGLISTIFADPVKAACVTIGISVANIVLRFYTTTPVGKQE